MIKKFEPLLNKTKGCLMITYNTIKALIIFVALTTTPLSAVALIPMATTSSNQSITATIDGIGLIYGLSTIETNAYAIAVSTNPGILNYPAIHASLASASVQAPVNETAIATFDSSYITLAKSFTSEPLFSRAAASSQSTAYALVAPSSASYLNLDWTFKTFGLQATPTSTFAYISDTIQVIQTFASGVQETVAGFFTYLENGKSTTGFWGDASTVEIIKNWFESNMNQIGNEITLNEASSPLALAIALAPQQEPFFLTVINTHNELSYEAPAVATNQTGDQIGHLSALDNNNISNQMHWDAGAGILSFDLLPINLLANNLGQSFINDPLNGGYLKIDPLQRMTDASGQSYFSGDTVSLLDKSRDVLFTASLPGVVFDDALFTKQGFNLFAPILNILDANSSTSPWLQDYLSNITIDSLLLPELFIGFNLLNVNGELWQQNFDTPVTSLLSFSGVPLKTSATVAEPSKVILLILSLLIIVSGRHYQPKALKISS